MGIQFQPSEKSAISRSQAFRVRVVSKSILADLGFKQISVEPVVAKPEDWYSIKEEDIPGLKEEYDKLAVEMIRRRKEGNGFNFFHFMIDLEAFAVPLTLETAGTAPEVTSIR